MMKTNIIRNILLLFLCGISLSVNSQTLPYYHYTTKDGLVDGLVHYTCQDKLGYIWFATWKGISRFDGNTFHNYNTTDGLIKNNIGGIATVNTSMIIPVITLFCAIATMLSTKAAKNIGR